MKNSNMIWNFGNDGVLINGKFLELKQASSGHYTLPLYFRLDSSLYGCVLMLAKGTDIKKMANILHKQFAHLTPSKLIELLKKADMSSAEIENEIKIVSENCVMCKKFKKPVPRPVVSLIYCI